MTEPVPTGNLKASLPAVRELSNCLPLWSVAPVSYNQPVYWTTAICPPPIVAPLPGLSVSVRSDVTPGGVAPLVGGASVLPLQAAVIAMSAIRVNFVKCMDASRRHHNGFCGALSLLRKAHYNRA